MGKGNGKGNCSSETCFESGKVCIGLTIGLAFLALSITKIVMGAVFIHDCSINYLVPVWLVVNGCSPILIGCCVPYSDDDASSCCSVFCGVINALFYFSWTITGGVWIYKAWVTMHSDDYVQCTDTILTECTEGTCTESLLAFAFAMVTMDIIIFFVLLVIGIGCVICS